MSNATRVPSAVAPSATPCDGTSLAVPASELDLAMNPDAPLALIASTATIAGADPDRRPVEPARDVDRARGAAAEVDEDEAKRTALQLAVGEREGRAGVRGQGHGRAARELVGQLESGRPPAAAAGREQGGPPVVDDDHDPARPRRPRRSAPGGPSNGTRTPSALIWSGPAAATSSRRSRPARPWARRVGPAQPAAASARADGGSDHGREPAKPARAGVRAAPGPWTLGGRAGDRRDGSAGGRSFDDVSAEHGAVARIDPHLDRPEAIGERPDAAS